MLYQVVVLNYTVNLKKIKAIQTLSSFNAILFYYDTSLSGA